VGIGTSSPASALTVSDGTASGLTPFGGTELFLDSSGDNYLQFGSGTSSSPAIYFGDSADGDVGGIIYAHASNAMSFRTNGSERMRITSTGNVGIGTASPSQKLTVEGTDARIYLTGANTDINMTGTADGQLSLDGNGFGFGIALNSSGANLYTNSASRALILGTDETERMRITGTGRVGIGTVAPATPLHVYGGTIKQEVASGVNNAFIGSTGSADSSYVRVQNTTGSFDLTAGNGAAYLTSTINGPMNFYTNNTEKMRITSAGLVGIGTTAPGGNLHVQGAAGNQVRLYLTDGDATGTANSLLISKSGTASFISDRQASSQLWFGTADTERMRIDTSGNVGIGTTVPDSAVTVYKSADALDGISIRQNSAGASAGARLKLGNNSDARDAEIVLTGSGNSSYAGARTLNFVSNIGGFGFYRSYTTPVATMVLDSSGNVGIGTTSPGNSRLAVLNGGAQAVFSVRDSANGRVQIGTTDYGVSNSLAADLQITNQALSGTVGMTFNVGDATNSGNIYWRSNTSNNTVQIVGNPGNNYLAFATNVAERMRIDSSGNIGIGTSSPSRKLEVLKSGVDDVYVAVIGGGSGAGGASVGIGASGTTSYIRGVNNGVSGYTPLNVGGSVTVLETNGSEKMRIDSSGNVGIGTSSVATNLHVYENTSNGTINNIALLDAGNQNPSVAGSGVAMDFRSNSGSSYFGAVGGYSDGTNYVAGLWGGAAASGAPDLVVNGSGNVGIGTSSPSYLTHLYSTSAEPKLVIEDASSGAGRGGVVTGTWGGNGIRLDSLGAAGWVYVGGGNTSYIPFTIGTEKARFHNNGNFGLGTTSPAKQFEITKSARATITSLTDGATITPDFDAAQNFAVTLGGNRTLANPSNIDPGQTGSIFVVQDVTGGRTLSFGSYWKFAGGTAPTLSTGTSATDRIDYVVQTSTAIHAVASLNLS